MYDLKQLSRLSETHNVKPTAHCLWLDSGPVIYLYVCMGWQISFKLSIQQNITLCHLC